VGYRQAWEWLDRQNLNTEEIGQPTPPLQDMIELGIIATRQLAKRQLTWLRSMPSRKVVDCLDPDLHPIALNHLKKFLGA
jgi:tRNA dimethylallyltransferase